MRISPSRSMRASSCPPCSGWPRRRNSPRRGPWATSGSSAPMPEGDTVYLAAKRLRAALAGRELTRTDFRVPRYATLDLSGRCVDDVVTHGKHMLVRIAGGITIHTHYRMDGVWHLYRHGERWQGPAWQVRVVLENATWVVVGFRGKTLTRRRGDTEPADLRG